MSQRSIFWQQNKIANDYYLKQKGKEIASNCTKYNTDKKLYTINSNNTNKCDISLQIKYYDSCESNPYVTSNKDLACTTVGPY